MNYYSLVAGLKEYALDCDKKGFAACDIIDQVRAELSEGDNDCLRLFYTYYDITNILNIISGREQFSTLGNFSKDELTCEIKTPDELPSYISNVLQAYTNPDNPEYDEIDHERAVEKSLFEAYYTECSRSGSKFIREWYEFDCNLRNVSAAFAARRAGIPISEVLVGDGYVTDTLSRSSAADFGLKGELEYMDDVIAAVGEEGNLLQKEHKIDTIRWDMSDELTTFNYFDMNAILAYLVKINIVQRWVSLDKGYGKEMFRKLVGSFSGSDMIAQAEKQYAK